MEETEDLHVLDLPALYTRPSAGTLLNTLELFRFKPSSFDQANSPQTNIDIKGLPQYLTSIVGSGLSWIPDDEDKEKVWEAASARLAERSGRMAQPSMSRTFRIPVPDSSPGPKVESEVCLTLFEPSLTADNLGHKTWTSSFVFARVFPRLARNKAFFPCLSSAFGNVHDVQADHMPTSAIQPMSILELGSGTGLAGLFVSRFLPHSHVDCVHLTDLEDIMSNLSRNVEANRPPPDQADSWPNVEAFALDWNECSRRWEQVHRKLQNNKPEVQTCNHSQPEGTSRDVAQYQLVIATDPLYSPEHPGLLVDVLRLHLQRSKASRFMLLLPLRQGYEAERNDLKKKLNDKGLQIVEHVDEERVVTRAEGIEDGWEDWGEGGGREGDGSEVQVWWAIYQY